MIGMTFEGKPAFGFEVDESWEEGTVFEAKFTDRKSQKFRIVAKLDGKQCLAINVDDEYPEGE